MKILVVEDEPELLAEIEFVLKRENYVCETAGTFTAAQDKLVVYEYDVAVVDITLPGGSGLQLIEWLKKNKKSTGIIIISARNSLDDKITGLDLGADDYLTKPFYLPELVARVKSLIRRQKFDGAANISFNEIEIFPDEGLVKINGNRVVFTKKELELLLFFVVNKNRLLTRESIAEHLWGDNIDLADNFDFIYTHVNNLRRKIKNAGGANYIQSVYGMGYKFIEG